MHGADGRLEVIAADVVEIDVDAVGCELAEAVPRLDGVVVERLDPELVQPGDLLARPGAADDRRAAKAGELGGGAADRAGRA